MGPILRVQESENVTDRLSRNVGKITTTSWVMTQKGAVPSYFATEA